MKISEPEVRKEHYALDHGLIRFDEVAYKRFSESKVRFGGVSDVFRNKKPLQEYSSSQLLIGLRRLN